MRHRWEHLLAEGPILADGAMGTMLFAAGLTAGEAPERWNLDHPDRVRAIHRGYLDAGARIVLTNTFGANRFRLALHGLQDRVAELNLAAARLLRDEIAAAGVHALAAGDIGPSGELLVPLGTLDPDAAADAFAEQAAALVAGGVDLLWIETMSDLGELEAAVRGARRAAPEIPLVATMSFDTHGRTMMGVTPAQAAETLAALGVDALGANCGRGPDEALAVVEAMRRAAPHLPIVAKPNVGLPELTGTQAVYRTEPAVMAEWALRFRDAGATIIGACCGSTPAHLAAMARALAGVGGVAAGEGRSPSAGAG